MTGVVSTPVGPLVVVAGPEGLREVRFSDDPPPAGEHDALVAEACSQLEAFVAGKRRAFELPLAPHGTPFQLDVWRLLAEVPYGETTTYGELAARLGKPPGASRAVGAANGANPLAILVPCHRVIGADGSLTGYAGGLHRKRWLLAHEGGGRQGELF